MPPGDYDSVDPPGVSSWCTPGGFSCFKCSMFGAREDFGPKYDPTRKGYSSWCKPCQAEYQRERRFRINGCYGEYERNRRYRRFPVAKSCTKCGILRAAEDFYNHRSNECRRCDNEKSKNWRKSNPGRMSELVSMWQANNPNRVQDISARRAARMKRNGFFEISDRDRKKLALSPCINCGSTEDLTVDHLIPIARGGRHSIGNLASMCRRCNSAKHTKTWAEFRFTAKVV